MLLLTCPIDYLALYLPQLPIILLGFAGLGGASIDPQVSAWIAVFVLPLNSAVNPVLYTVSAVSWTQVCRYGHQGSVPGGSVC